MILNSPYISGSLTVTGNITAQGGIAISGSIASASFAVSASEASKVQGLGSASFAPATTFNTVSQSYATTSGSISSRVTLIEGQYATTGSNNFTKPQQVSDVSNAISFTSTASLYTAGGLRVSKDSFVSGTAYFNNIVVYGTSSIQYITSSQLDISDNIISVNTFTPAVRFGGLAVYDSGSTSLTGSMLWDSENNRWIYSNPSGSSYDGGMIISGPRNTTGLGNEKGTTACYLMAGQGGDHITSSAIYTDSTASCFYGGTSFFSSNGDVCFSNLGYVGNTLGVGITPKPGDGKLQLALGTALTFGNSNSVGADYSWISDGSYNFSGGNAFVMATEKGRPIVLATSGSARMCIASTGIATFTCQTCAPAFYANTTTGRSFGNDNYGSCFGWISLYNTIGGVQVGMEGCTGGQLVTGAPANSAILVGKTGLAISANNGVNNHLNISSAGLSTFSNDILIGSGDDVTRLNAWGGIVTSGDGRYNILSMDSTAYGTGVGGGISFGGNYNTAAYAYTFAYIKGIKENSTAGNYASALVFGTRANGGTPTERMRVSSDGIAVFCCQICLKERAYISGTFPGVTLDRSATSAQSDIQWKDAGASVWSIGTAVAAVGSNLDFYSYGLGNVLKLVPTGEACFRYVVCAQGGIIPGNGASLLNYYTESASFTPCLYFQGAVSGLSYATRSGYYTRIGNIVTAQMYIQWCKASSATDNIGVYLPVYTANNSTPPIGNFYSGNQPSETRPISVYLSPNSNLGVVLTQGGQGNLSNCFANSTLHYWMITATYLA